MLNNLPKVTIEDKALVASELRQSDFRIHPLLALRSLPGQRSYLVIVICIEVSRSTIG